MSQQKKRYARFKAISLLRLAVLLLPLSAGAEEEDMLKLDSFEIPLWNYSAELRGGFGYKDNVLLSHTNSQGSAFWISGAELMAFRLPTQGWQFQLFADASDVRYFDSPSVGSEQIAIAAAQLSKDFGGGWKSTLALSYLFQNQVFDYSSTYTNETSVGQIVGHTFAPRWGVRKTTGKFWLEGEINLTRQWLEEPLDDYWQLGPRAAVGRSWDQGSELTLSYQYSLLDYDNREQVDTLGGAMTNTSLALQCHGAELSFTAVWDKAKRWQTITSLGYEINLDNGSGFYDYDNFRASQQIRYREERWEITLRARISHYQYSSQTVSADDPALRRKTMLSVSLHTERKLTKHLKAHASYVWDRSISSLDFDDYSASNLFGGLAWVF